MDFESPAVDREKVKNELPEIAALMGGELTKILAQMGEAKSSNSTYESSVCPYS